MKGKTAKVIGMMTFLVVIGLLVVAGTINFSPNPPGEVTSEAFIDQTSNDQSKSRGAYDCNVRVYITEIVSRYDDSDDIPFHYGFMDYGLDTNLLMGYQETFQTNIRWDGLDAGFDSLKEENMMVFAAVFNNESVPAYSDPPSGGYFLAELAEATAAATAFETWPDTAYSDFTHRVFGEKITATW